MDDWEIINTNKGNCTNHLKIETNIENETENNITPDSVANNSPYIGFNISENKNPEIHISQYKSITSDKWSSGSDEESCDETQFLIKTEKENNTVNNTNLNDNLLNNSITINKDVNQNDEKIDYNTFEKKKYRNDNKSNVLVYFGIGMITIIIIGIYKYTLVKF